MPRAAIAAVMNVTEPLRTRYLSYYPAVASWARQVDQVYVVDGHSEEDLLEIPRRLFGSLPNVEIVRAPETLWGPGARWHAMQSMHNLLFPLRTLGVDRFDAVFMVGSDQIAYPGVRRGVEAAPPAVRARGGWCRFHRSRLLHGRYVRRADARGVVIFPEPGATPQPLHGWDREAEFPSDFPIHATHHSRYADPVNGAVKTVFAGPPLAARGTLDVECASHGHFWYTEAECLEKVFRWDEALARFFGRTLRSGLEHRLAHGLFGIVGALSLDQVLGWEHPPEMREVLAHFYQPGMLGGAVREVSGPTRTAAKLMRAVLHADGALRTRALRRRGYRGLADAHVWVPLDEPAPPPVDVAALYQEQDRLQPLPHRARPPGGGHRPAARLRL
ncbi:MAG TPA: hypothetical protein VEW03_07915 [Longimicrobiaceae bacterium]|nr:hypothetical protein [Longimicrobiaceae bacterium]